MLKKTDKTIFLTVRMKQSELDLFREHCQEVLKRRQSDVMREMITALIEGRLKIEPTQAYKELYK